MRKAIGRITEIQHASVHDGPGIRTTVFMKGCNMRCSWCHNPETIYPHPEILHLPEKCISCGRCEEGCFSGAKKWYGKEISIEDAMEEIRADLIYYGTDGGLTVTGGEPLLQHEFVTELLKVCKEEGIGTAMETNMSMPYSYIKKAAEFCSLIMCDLKIFDEALHIKYTGLSNLTIKENIARLSQTGIPMIVRTPVIGGVNDEVEEIRKIVEFLSDLEKIQVYELLTYHPLGVSKGDSEYFKPERFERLDKEKINLLAGEARKRFGVVRIDGVPFQPEP